MRQLHDFILRYSRRNFLYKKNYTNYHNIPILDHLTLSSSLPIGGQEEKILSPTLLAIEKISHQKPQKTYAKLSIADYHLKKGQLLGCFTTLRSTKITDFIMMLNLLVFPIIPDYPGIGKNSWASPKSITLGFSDLSFFPEVERDFDILDSIKGMQVSFTTKAKRKEDSLLILTAYRLPCFS